MRAKTSRRLPVKPGEALQRSARLLSAGSFRTALEAAREGLAADPRDPDLCNVAGICAASLGDAGLAEALWRRALEAAPHAAGLWLNLGLLLEGRARHAEAEQCLRAALEHDRANGAALSALGGLLAAAGRAAEAETCYRRAVGFDPGDVAAHVNLGVLLAARRQDEAAEQCYRCALDIAPGNAEANSNLGILLARHGRDEEAEACYRRALATAPGAAEIHTNLGLLLEKHGRLEDAEQCQRQALSLAPERPQVLSNLANLVAARGRAEEAERYYRRALASDPGAAATHSNLGVLLADEGRDAEAEGCFRQALALDPGHALARLNLAFLLLSLGRFAEGWPHFEARYDQRLPEPDAPMPSLPCPRWQGEPLAGKSLLVWPEQGLGDLIQFCRYLPIVKARGAASVTLACRPTLRPLMETLAGVDAVVPADAAAVPARYDYWVFALSLPLYCGTGVDNIPAAIPYLHAMPERIAAWAPRLPREGFRVGLAWRGNARHANDAARSLPDLAALAPLWSVPGVRFVSLQKGAGEDEAAGAPASRPIVDLAPGIVDFGDTAAIVAQLDLVICVDTSVAHVAGALGKPCWVLLPSRRTDWRWMRCRADSPWYPGTMRLFRQGRGEGWGPTVAAVKDALALAAGRRSDAGF